jgi:hypothetical protein
LRTADLPELGSEKGGSVRIIHTRALYSTHPDPVVIIGMDTINMVVEERRGVSDNIPEDAKPVSVIPV